MQLTSRNYIKGDYEKYIKKLTKENMQQLFIDNFGGWSDLVNEKKILNMVNEGFIQLFFLKNNFIGYVSFNSEKNNPISCLINDIHIIKQFQKQGYGTKILNFVINKTINLDYKQLKVFVFKNNPSLNFYKKKGFKEIEHLKKSNTLIMIKKI